LSEREKKFILASAPPQKFSLNPEFGHKNFTVGTRFTYFGKIVLDGYGDGQPLPLPYQQTMVAAQLPDQYVYSGKIVSDLYFATS
jgi:iron complex outermembrane receptor protein